MAGGLGAGLELAETRCAHINRALNPHKHHQAVQYAPLPVPLSRCEWLDKKNTIFGRIAGETIYNLIKMNEYEVL